MDLPDSVDVAVQRALAKDPNDRYSSTREFAAALALAFSPSGANVLSGATAIEKTKNRRRIFYVAGAAALVVALLWPVLRKFGPVPTTAAGNGRAAAGTTERVWSAIVRTLTARQIADRGVERSVQSDRRAFARNVVDTHPEVDAVSDRK